MMAPLILTASVVLTVEHGHGANDSLDPRGTTHIPIGIANTVDTLKTFVEAEGNFSPGFATYGIYFWLYDPVARKLAAPTMETIACEHGLPGVGNNNGILDTELSDIDIVRMTLTVQPPGAEPKTYTELVELRNHKSDV